MHRVRFDFSVLGVSTVIFSIVHCDLSTMSSQFSSLTALAFSLHQGPRQLALLLGSGISRSAGIPTGWGITLDLISKLPDSPENCAESDLVDWYRNRYGLEPDYSSVVEGLANSSVERRNLLRGYFEPTDVEREDEKKIPTPAHRAIAKMVAMKVVRVVITTNFDRLVEQALGDEGIVPDIIEHESKIDGAMPYGHSDCLLLKLHGDYLDTRLRNTSVELEEYPEAMRKYLLRLLDDHGLIVCGWSAEYDSALVDAIQSSPNRRFGMYWMHVAPVSNQAEALLGSRRGIGVPIQSADQAFTELVEKLQSLRDIDRTNPLDVAMAVATTKRNLAKPDLRIALEDFIFEEMDAARKWMATEEFNPNPEKRYEGQSFLEEYRTRIVRYEACCERLVATLGVLAFHGDVSQATILTRVLNTLAKLAPPNVQNRWASLALYPAYLVMYCCGVAAVAGRKLATVGEMLRNTTAPSRWQLEEVPFVREVTAGHILGERGEQQFLHSTEFTRLTKLYAPADDYLAARLQKLLVGLHLSPSEIDAAFSQFHYLLQLAYIDFNWDLDKGGWAPPGRFYQHGRMGMNWEKTPQAKIEIELLGSPENFMIRSGFFAGSLDRLAGVNQALRKFLDGMAERSY